MAARGASPASGGAGPAGPAPSQDIMQVRNATNWRTVTRNDPAVVEIIDTSTYATIYHYDAAGEKWEKQKQEGPLFIVRRSKAPEYAIYMLNRQAVKNVTIPLIPGEMKATAIDASMLQVARRGEKIRYGIWFPEGTADVQRFRESIVQIVGEPSKPGQGQAASRGSPAAAAPGTSAPAPATSTGGDGLSRLFAGLTTVPAPKPTNSNSQSPQPLQPVSNPQQQYSQSQYPQHPNPYPQQAYRPPNVAPFHGPGGYYSPATGSSEAPSPQPPVQPPIVAPSFAPGQTVDDLLKGIMAPHSTPSKAVAPFAPPPAAVPAPGNSNANANANRTSPPSNATSNSTSSPVRSPPGLQGPPGPPGLVPMQAQRPGQNRAISSPRRPGPNGFPSPGKQHPLQPREGPPHNPQAQPQPPNAMRDSLVNTFAPDGARPPPVPKEQLVNTLIHLLQSNPAFGDDVWKAYMARCGVPQ